MRSARALTVAAAAAAFVMALASGPGTRLDLWPWQTGFALLRWATYTGIAAGIAAIALALLHLLPKWRPLGQFVPMLALFMAIAAAAPPLLMLMRAKSVPPIHDITTDFEHPPVFITLRSQRDASPNGSAYGGAQVAAAQQSAYPDIKAKFLPMSTPDALQRATELAHAMGWQVVATDTIDGRMEATATTTWFGFKDDIVVRVREDNRGTRVDIRSASRVGKSDIGANAARVRTFLRKLS